MRTVAIFSKPNHPQVAHVAPELVAWLRQRGYKTLLDDPTARAMATVGASFEEDAVCDWAGLRPDLAIVLGGDGTLLRVARLLRDAQVPLLGVNLGTLGFLAEVAIPQLYANLEGIFSRCCLYDIRTVLAAEIYRGGQMVAQFDALNDAVVSKGTLARIIAFEIKVDGARVSIYRGDGLVIATPTGSTAYSLSAGGPIIHPAVDALVMTPICPHALTNRPVIVRDSSVIEITLVDAADQTFLTMDGQQGIPLEDGDRLVCRKSPYVVTLVRLARGSFFEVLRNKLNWT